AWCASNAFPIIETASPILILPEEARFLGPRSVANTQAIPDRFPSASQQTTLRPITTHDGSAGIYG
ncbi:MAG: hypothetical protein WA894_07090, partial [Candidatus Acidiferrum sp.]